jgi:hypothetical protein
LDILFLHEGEKKAEARLRPGAMRRDYYSTFEQFELGELGCEPDGAHRLAQAALGANSFFTQTGHLHLHCGEKKQAGA